MSPKLPKKDERKGKAITGKQRTLSPLLIRNHIMDRRLSNVHRWGITPMSRQKCVAEHTFYVARIARRICEVLAARQLEDNEVNVLKVVDMALMHDEEEALTGDIVHTFKNVSRKFRQQVERQAFTLLRKEYDGVPNADYFLDVRMEFEAKETIEAQIVEVADILASIAECEEEIRLGNVQEFQKLQQNCALMLGRVSYPWFRAIQDLLTFRGV